MGLRPCRLRLPPPLGERQLRRPSSCVRRVCMRARTAFAVLRVSAGEAIVGAVDGRTTPETHTATPVVKNGHYSLYTL